MSKKNWIKSLRLEKGLTQEKAAALVSVHVRTWRRWELTSISKKNEILIKHLLAYPLQSSPDKLTPKAH